MNSLSLVTILWFVISFWYLEYQHCFYMIFKTWSWMSCSLFTCGQDVHKQMATYLRNISNEEGTYTVVTIIHIYSVTVLTRWYGLKGDHWHDSRDRRIPLSDSYVALTALTIYYDGTLSTSQSWSKPFVEISIMDKGFEPKFVFHFVACVLSNYMYLRVC